MAKKSSNGAEQNSGEHVEDLQPTPAAEFRAMREYGVLKELPSGRAVRMRNVPMAQLLRQEHIPDMLATLTLRSFYGVREENELLDFMAPQQDAQAALDLHESLRIVCTLALISPRIVKEPQDDDEIEFEDLPQEDRVWIFMLAYMDAEILRSYRFDPAPGGDGPQLSEAAE